MALARGHQGIRYVSHLDQGRGTIQLERREEELGGILTGTWSIQSFIRSRGKFRRKYFWMENLCQDFEAGGDARAGTVEVGRRIREIDALVPYRLQAIPTGPPRKQSEEHTSELQSR